MATANYPPLSGPTYPDTLEEQLRALESDEALRAFAEARQRLASDPYRPAYHFSPPQNVMNDPNGLCFWQGRWHLFFQYRPGGAEDRVHWGHTVSDDLIHWRDLPLALYPDTEKDCYSGQTLVEDDRVIAIYHGTESGQCHRYGVRPAAAELAGSIPNNPIIPMVPIDETRPSISRIRPVHLEAGRRILLLGERARTRTACAGEDCQGIDHLFPVEGPS